ncbi:MAG: gamma-glutamylcyclotransferase [SAR324 cluster bacterium]|nr:gamma-glutamylcyclotransferase [SAR324 cluster bacterium]
MNDNSQERLFEVFFYGLYMDPQILKIGKGVEPRNPRPALLKSHTLRIGKMATLLREKNASAFGVVYSLNQKEVYALYQGSGLVDYTPEAVMVEVGDGEHSLAALTYTLIIPPEKTEENEDYKAKLKLCLENLGLPTTQLEVA